MIHTLSQLSSFAYCTLASSACLLFAQIVGSIHERALRGGLVEVISGWYFTLSVIAMMVCLTALPVLALLNTLRLLGAL